MKSQKDFVLVLILSLVKKLDDLGDSGRCVKYESVFNKICSLIF